MKEEVKISVIIAAYNVEKYLERTLLSIVNQSFTDIEIIIVNDGSSDRTGEIAEKAGKEDDRIHVFHTDNNGVSSARNFAIEKARGKYIYFMDADDYVDKDMLELVYEQAAGNNSDLVVFGFFFETWRNEEMIQSFPTKCEYKIYDNKEKIRENLVHMWDCNIFYNVWNKLFRSEIISKYNISFEKMKFGEDLQFNIDYLFYCSSIVSMDRCFYHYIRERQGSATSAYISGLFETRKKEFRQINKLFEFWGVDKDRAAIEYTSRRYAERIVGCIENIFENGGPSSISSKLSEIKKITKSKSVQYSIKYAKPRSKMIKIVLFLVKYKKIFLLYLFGESAFTIRRKCPALFNKLKYSR